MPAYRIFCDREQAKELPDEVKIRESYAAFCIVEATEAVIKPLRKKFPIEKLNSNKAESTLGHAALESLARDNAATTGAYRVQFSAPVKKAWLTQLAKSGGKVIDTLGDSSVMVECKTQKAIKAVQEHAFVEKIENFKPAIKLGVEFVKGLRKGKPKPKKQIEKSIKQAADALDSEPAAKGPSQSLRVPGAIVAKFFTDTDAKRAQKALSSLGAKSSFAASSNRLVVDLNSAKNPQEALKSLVQKKGLKRIEELKIPTLSNDVAREIIGDNVVNVNPESSRLTGKGEIVAVADSGLDTGDPATIHADFKGRIVEITSLPIDPAWNDFITNQGGDDGPADKNSGHGTHVTGSVLGNGKRATVLNLSQQVQGVAPEAKLVFQAIEQRPDWTPEVTLDFLISGEEPPVATLFGIPEDLNDLFQPAFDKGARIHNNSWGGGTPGEYDSQCEDLDEFVWNHKDFLVVVAAGNSGSDVSPKDGHIDQTSIDSPATAKNCLTVGASENDRKDQFPDEYGEWWPGDFSKDPIKTDSMVDNIDDVVAFSSRGPCNTGRRKPDVVAPGTFILSTRSSQIASNNFAWKAFPPAKKDYMYMGGTSMASPLVAGCAAVVRQFLRKSVGINKPSAALLKASIIHSAQYRKYRFAHPASDKFADNEQGWGRVELESIINPTDSRKLIFKTASGLNTGTAKQFDVKLTGAGPLKVTLVYSDFPGEELINNLNLIVTSPSGTFMFGNDFDGSGVPDNLNNVEGVFIKSPEAGVWDIKVVASEVLQGPQDFALVVSGPAAELM